MHASLIGSKRAHPPFGYAAAAAAVTAVVVLVPLPSIRHYGRKHISNYNIARRDHHGQTENSINYAGAETNA